MNHKLTSSIGKSNIRVDSLHKVVWTSGLLHNNTLWINCLYWIESPLRYLTWTSGQRGWLKKNLLKHNQWSLKSCTLLLLWHKALIYICTVKYVQTSAHFTNGTTDSWSDKNSGVTFQSGLIPVYSVPENILKGAKSIFSASPKIHVSVEAQELCLMNISPVSEISIIPDLNLLTSTSGFKQ